ncbi:hypothetical protein BCR44DRAFT_1428890 [Catenaria anguillulae PL171]|uniref:Uncharacterized protein n=1 Tax=Catenaria anguillulae PL171 TaxID=765915 RepID=A0A1Y2HWX0_9FUNG|nr:hypothetical protein BCR44DRAFT_1428890 [Catenaria anguillulae PL171]
MSSASVDITGFLCALDANHLPLWAFAFVTFCHCRLECVKRMIPTYSSNHASHCILNKFIYVDCIHFSGYLSLLYHLTSSSLCACLTAQLRQAAKFYLVLTPPAPFSCTY